MLGGTGEYAALSTAQRPRSAQLALEEAKGRVPVVAGVLESGFGQCKAFEEIGADAPLVLWPVPLFLY